MLVTVYRTGNEIGIEDGNTLGGKDDAVVIDVCDTVKERMQSLLESEKKEHRIIVSKWISKQLNTCQK